MSKQPRDPELSHRIAVQLKSVIRDRGLSRSQAAEILGVKRQTLWLYLQEKSTPGADVLKRAAQLLGMTIPFREQDFDAGAFGPVGQPPAPIPEQMNLFQALDRLTSKQLETSVVGWVGDYFELKVRIKSTA